ncbi:PREDICTED: ATP-binding cassette sub-family G member 2-like isoform X4 [Chinchilla lanigera]|uniref:ATP-binding cassette sub-family G member 2-like isoform X4 n=1 Tax=Chinchilla lanigera TaxID=34839 RepID=UPI0006962819|nr:PREDICTED: ATP-binding cassette sub-family G member 2-like isoform X4 [Chinchilla lanigera]
MSSHSKAEGLQMCSRNGSFFIPILQNHSKDLPGMTPSDLKTCTEGAVLSFHNISYRVQAKSGFLLRQKTVEKEILSDMSGIMKPGLNAILGPPRAGKSLLLNVLAARKNPHGLSGDILINGEPYPANFKCYSGYVAQGDVMKGTLTVRENLQFSAALRLPAAVTNHEKKEKINRIIEELGLDKVADSKVGTEFIPGLSGAERKKTNIGMELITDPSILFLDEPTNGFDSSTAHAVFLLLKRLSKAGRTIIFSIHQPQDSIFKMFDSLTLLASGKLVFHGPASEAVRCFASAGYICEPCNNPADFFLDVINGDSSAVALSRQEEDYGPNETEELCKREKSVIENLAEFYAKSSICRKIKDNLDQLSGAQKKRSIVFKETTYVTSFYHQFKWIVWRSFKNLLGDPQISIARAAIPFIVGLVISCIFLGLRNHCTLFQHKASILFVLTIYQSFSFLAAVETFVLEKKLFMHEYISGYYGLSSYFLGKLLCDLLCRKLLPSIIFNCILYCMLGLKRTAGAFLVLMLSLAMVSCSAHFLALAIAAGQGVVFLTTRLMDIYFVFMMALQHNEFLGEDYCVGLNTTESSSCPNYVIKAETLQMCSSNDKVCIPVSQRNTRGLLGMTLSELKTCTERTVLSFHNLSYQVKMKSGFLIGRKTVKKEILSNISGIMEPGLNAIMGPAGAGKSVLLDVLSARKDPHGLSGDVLINGAPHPADFKCHSGYVVQDHVMMNTLTVRENLQFSAAFRLPMTMTNLEKTGKINKVIEDLHLNKVADSKVGGLSGAERKKTSIAMELITDPSILFLDEPTNGLDSSTAHAVLLLLKGLSRQGRTIIFSIHQPRHSIFMLFDSLTLLASGKLMFHGPAQEAVQYFESAGYHSEPYSNPAEFFLDIINGNSSAVVLSRDEEDCEANGIEESSNCDKPVIQKLAECYADSSFYRKTKAELEPLSGSLKKRNFGFKEITYATSFFHQLRWIARRSLRNLLGNPQASIAQIIVIIVMGLVIGAIFLVLKNDCNEIQNRALVLFMLTVYECFSNKSAGEIFVVEKKLFIHEYISGYYRLSSYYLGKLLCELLPRRLLPSILFTCIPYFMLGSKPELKAFLTMTFTLMMVRYSASSLALAIAVGQNGVSITTLLMNIYFLFMMIFLAMSLYFETMAPQLLWLQYLSIPHYGFMALQHNEFLGQIYCAGLNATESSSCLNYIICYGDEYLTTYDTDLSPWGLWKNHVALACMMIIFLTIAYLKLLFLRKHP